MGGHAALGGGDVAGLEHLEHLAVLEADRGWGRPARTQLGDTEADLAAERGVEAFQAGRAYCRDKRLMEGAVPLDDLTPAGVVGEGFQARDCFACRRERRAAL